jgi:hypothetical protein
LEKLEPRQGEACHLSLFLLPIQRRSFENRSIGVLETSSSVSATMV